MESVQIRNTQCTLLPTNAARMTDAVKKTTRLRALIESPELCFLCEAHNGMSARIVQEAGFQGIWGSGLTISAQFGVRDNNEASWTQVLENVEFMADATEIPILLDGDTGYGNFNNMRRLVRKLCARGVAGVCIEDKKFPKTNSFIKGTQQALADIDEFCGKIKAGKDAQLDDDFVIVARVEAFIAGLGLDEALRRAEAYHAAGADAILIHSALRSPDEVLAFKDAWDDRCPVVIVPTKYYSTPTEVFVEYAFSTVIWANQVMRGSISAMKDIASRIFSERSLLTVEDDVVPVSEVFRLQGADELELAEERYLPKAGGTRASAVVLAASRGKELGELTLERPKVMVNVRGRPILEHILSAYREIGVEDITVVRGYKADTVSVSGVRFADNPNFESTGEAYSLRCALEDWGELLENRLLVSYGDVLFRRYIPDALLEVKGDFVVVVDTNWQESVNQARAADYARCSAPYSRQTFGDRVLLEDIGSDLEAERTSGEWMGFLSVAGHALPALRKAVDQALVAVGPTAGIPDVISNLIVDRTEVAVMYTTGNWLDVDSLDDIVAAGEFL